MFAWGVAASHAIVRPDRLPARTCPVAAGRRAVHCRADRDRVRLCFFAARRRVAASAGPARCAATPSSLAGAGPARRSSVAPLMAFARRDVGRDAFKSVVGRWGRFHAHALEEIGRTEEAIEEIQGALRLLSGRQARLGMLFNRLGREARGQASPQRPVDPHATGAFVHKVQVDCHGREGIAGLSVVSVIPGGRAGHPRLCRDERAADGTIFGLARPASIQCRSQASPTRC
jgi:hypothetical protein